ncbi:MAG: hypothetical protein RR420_05430 [Anaerovoracaceae bacterium]
MNNYKLIVKAEIYKKGLEDGFICTEDMELVKAYSCEIDEGLCRNCCEFHPYIDTERGQKIIKEGDYIVSINGDKYPVSPEIFQKNYERVE